MCAGMIVAIARIATTGGTGADFGSFTVGGCDAGAIDVIVQQQLVPIVETGGDWRFFAFAGQQHASRTRPSMLHKKLVRANAAEGSSTTSVSKIGITRRTSPQP
jgi:hypothetical protein